MIQQLSGRYKVKASHLKPLYQEVMGLLSGFDHVRLQHVPREQNTEADRLANLGVGSQGLGVGDPVANGMGWINPPSANSNTVAPPEPCSVIRNVRPSAEA